MGEETEIAVVEQQLPVRGLNWLRVIVASVVPTLISGNTQALAIMIGETGPPHSAGRTHHDSCDCHPRRGR
jgi:choline dehydrogenase-like flavoprotein